VSSWKAVEGSNGEASADGSGSANSTGGRVGSKVGSEGSTFANNGSKARVWNQLLGHAEKRHLPRLWLS